MVDRLKITDEIIQDYLDGRLSDEEQARIAAYLDENPELREEVEKVRTLNENLKRVGTKIIREPIPSAMNEILANARERIEPKE